MPWHLRQHRPDLTRDWQLSHLLRATVFPGPLTAVSSRITSKVLSFPLNSFPGFLCLSFNYSGVFCASIQGEQNEEINQPSFFTATKRGDSDLSTNSPTFSQPGTVFKDQMMSGSHNLYQRNGATELCRKCHGDNVRSQNRCRIQNTDLVHLWNCFPRKVYMGQLAVIIPLTVQHKGWES